MVSDTSGLCPAGVWCDATKCHGAMRQPRGHAVGGDGEDDGGGGSSDRSNGDSDGSDGDGGGSGDGDATVTTTRGTAAKSCGGDLRRKTDKLSHEEST